MANILLLLIMIITTSWCYSTVCKQSVIFAGLHFEDGYILKAAIDATILCILEQKAIKSFEEIRAFYGKGITLFNLISSSLIPTQLLTRLITITPPSQ